MEQITNGMTGAEVRALLLRNDIKADSLLNWTAGTYVSGQKRVGTDGALYRVRPNVTQTAQEPSASASDWEPIGGDPKKWIITEGGSAANLTFKHGFYVGASGTAENSESLWSYSNFVQVFAGEAVRVKSIGDFNLPMVALYATASLASYIETLRSFTASVSEVDAILTIPSNGYMIVQGRISGDSDLIDVTFLDRGEGEVATRTTDAQELFDLAKSKISKSDMNTAAGPLNYATFDELLNGTEGEPIATFTAADLHHSNPPIAGIVADNSIQVGSDWLNSWGASVPIPINEGNTIKWTAYVDAIGTKGPRPAILFVQSETFTNLSQVLSMVPTNKVGFNDYVFTAPENGFIVLQSRTQGAALANIRGQLFAQAAGVSPVIAKISDLKKVGNASVRTQDTFYPQELIKFTFNTPSSLPSAKGTKVHGPFELNIDGEVTTGWASLEVQGSSSAAYPKKNWTVELFADEARTQKIELTVGGQMPHSEFVIKSNWVDFTNARNIVSMRIWKQMQEARRGRWPLREIDLSYEGLTGWAAMDTGATGFVNGFPCSMVIKGAFYGIGTFNIGKKKQNYNLSDAVPSHMQIEDIAGQINFGTMVKDVAYEYRVMGNEALNEALMSRFKAMANADIAAFSSNADDFFHNWNIIDAVLLIDFCASPDCVGKNTLWTSYDSERILYMPYDWDMVFGANWGGVTMDYPADADPFQISGGNPAPTVAFWGKIQQHYAVGIAERYADLRSSVFTVENVFYHLKEFERRFTQKLYKAEYERWPALPNKDSTNTAQICDFVKRRLVYLDAKYDFK